MHPSTDFNELYSEASGAFEIETFRENINLVTDLDEQDHRFFTALNY